MSSNVASGPAPASSFAEAPQKLKSSCDACSASKVRCESQKPTCSRCANMGHPCSYSAARRVGRRHGRGPSYAKKRAPAEPRHYLDLLPSSHITTATTTRPAAGPRRLRACRRQRRPVLPWRTVAATAAAAFLVWSRICPESPPPSSPPPPPHRRPSSPPRQPARGKGILTSVETYETRRVMSRQAGGWPHTFIINISSSSSSSCSTAIASGRASRS